MSTIEGRTLRITADFFAEEAVKLIHAKVEAGERIGADFADKIVQPLLDAHGADGVAVLALSAAKLAHLATQYFAQDKGLTIEAVLDLYAVDRHRRSDPGDGAA